MKVVCILNNLNQAPNPETVSRLKKHISLPDGELDLQIGKEYIVYGIEFRDNQPWYYLCSETHDEYPIPVAADFFEIVDSRLSRHWKLCFLALKSKPESKLVFAEWASDIHFYENLINGDKQATAIFSKYRKLMEAEE
ncbi:SMI1/KNR4 family protein [Pseudomonas sp. IT-P2]|jgi:hypothetical protein|uniref:hypothetical protein n=1 Tax=Pseudomonas sp. IT-P2 TaxID=3026456 RepID=UPI0039E0DC7C